MKNILGILYFLHLGLPYNLRNIFFREAKVLEKLFLSYLKKYCHLFCSFQKKNVCNSWVVLFCMLLLQKWNKIKFVFPHYSWFMLVISRKCRPSVLGGLHFNRLCSWQPICCTRDTQHLCILSIWFGHVTQHRNSLPLDPLKPVAAKSNDGRQGRTIGPINKYVVVLTWRRRREVQLSASCRIRSGSSSGSSCRTPWWGAPHPCSSQWSGAPCCTSLQD
jgi:hypothetical protein